MSEGEIPREYRGWWRIVETSQWGSDDLDILGPALLSLTGYADRLRMHCLLAYVNAKPTKTGVSFTWDGAWEFDQVSGTGSVRLGVDGRLKGHINVTVPEWTPPVSPAIGGSSARARRPSPTRILGARLPRGRARGEGGRGRTAPRGEGRDTQLVVLEAATA